MKKIIFRADGNAQIGLGHVMRCLALAEMLGADYDRRFAIVQPSPEISWLIHEKGVMVIRLETNESAEFLAVLRPDDVLVLDGYSFSEPYQRMVWQKAKKLVFIDDLVEGYQVADVVINHAGAVTEYDYRAKPYTQFLLGTRYLMLRSEFFRPVTPPSTEGTIFVSLGGADPHNVSAKVLDGLRIVFRQLGQSRRVHLVVGPFHPNRAGLAAYEEHIEHLSILSNLSAAQIANELEKCQLAIVACSTVAYEACALSRPILPIQTADNQMQLAKFFTADLGTAFLQHNDSVSFFATQIRTALASANPTELLLKRRSRFFDGQSPERFRHLFARLCA